MKERLEQNQVKCQSNLPNINPNRSKIESNHNTSRLKRCCSINESIWKQVKSTSNEINCRYHHTAVLATNTGLGASQAQLYVYGGFNNNLGVLKDFKVYQCMDLFQNQFGNQGNSLSSKSKWVNLSTQNGPGPRHSHSAVIHDQVIYIFGGKVNRFNSTDSLYGYFIKQKKWRQIQTFDGQKRQQKQKKKQQQFIKAQKSFTKKNQKTQLNNNKKNNQIIELKNRNKPLPIDSHKAVIFENQMIVFGGFCNNQFTNNVYSLNLTTKIWKKLYPSSSMSDENNQKILEPEPRSDFSMVVYSQSLYIYGGRNLDNNFSDLWQFNLKTLKFRKLKDNSTDKKENRSGHSAVIYQDYMLIFGGISTVVHEKDDLICYSFRQDKWVNIWSNSQDRKSLTNRPDVKFQQINHEGKKSKHKKISHIRSRSPQLNSSLKYNNEQQNQAKQLKKYRRPIAEQKQHKIKRQNKGQINKYKKHNQRKYMLINQIQTVLKPYDNFSTQQYSPLIQSLTNSIMITLNTNKTNTNTLLLNQPRAGSVSKQNLSASMNQKKSFIQNFQESQTNRNYQRQWKLKARDGHTAHIFNNQMIIFGGDRHLISINDIVYINLEMIKEIINNRVNLIQNKN